MGDRVLVAFSRTLQTTAAERGDLDLHWRVKRTLIKTLGRVMRRVERGREGAAREVLSRLLNQIDAAARTQMDSETAARLRAAALEIIDSLNVS